MHNLWVLFIYFFLLVMLLSELPKIPTELPVRGFPGVWKLLVSWLPPRDGSPSLTFLSLFLSFIFCPTSFQRKWAAFLGAWCPLPAFRSCFVEFAQRSNFLSMNLWGKMWSPCPVPPPSYSHQVDHVFITILALTALWLELSIYIKCNYWK